MLWHGTRFGTALLCAGFIEATSRLHELTVGLDWTQCPVIPDRQSVEQAAIRMCPTFSPTPLLACHSFCFHHWTLRSCLSSKLDNGAGRSISLHCYTLKAENEHQSLETSLLRPSNLGASIPLNLPSSLSRLRPRCFSPLSSRRTLCFSFLSSSTFYHIYAVVLYAISPVRFPRPSPISGFSCSVGEEDDSHRWMQRTRGMASLFGSNQIMSP